MDWKAMANVLGTALTAGVVGAVASWQMNPAAPWQAHAAAGAIAALASLQGHLRQSPLPDKKPS